MARIGGMFPFPLAQVSEGGGIIELGSGGIYYPPAGEFVFTSGQVTVLQTFDPIAQMWRSVQWPTLQSQYISSDGANYRLLNASGIVVGAAITAPGAAAAANGIGSVVTGVTVTFSAPVSGQANQTATGYAIVGGSVQAPTITQAGAGFLTPPLIIIDPPTAGGIQATATCTLTAAGGIAAVTMQNVGAGYAAAPNFWISPQFANYPGGPSGSFAAGANPAPGPVFLTNALPGNTNTSPTGAQLTSNPLTGALTLTGIVVVNPGQLYDGTHIPVVTIAGMTGAAATAIMAMSLTGVTLVAGGVGYGAGLPPNFQTSLGLVASTNNNNAFIGREARGVTTIAGGAVTGFTIEDPGFGLQKVPVVTVLNTSAIATTQATGTAVCGGQNDINVLQPRVQ